MIYTLFGSDLSLDIDDKLVEHIIKTGKAHYPNEFGGLLIGYYSSCFKHLKITDTLLPIVYSSGRSFFKRDVIGIENKLKDLYAKDPSTYYVGEWHTHPDYKPFPSRIDIEALQQIINSPTVSIKNPIMLIVAYNGQITELGIFVVLNDNLYKYEQS